MSIASPAQGMKDEADTMTGKTWAMAIFLLLSFGLCRPAPAQDRTPYLPDVQLTPGHAGHDTAADICKPEYDNPASNIPIKLKERVFAKYRLNKYEVGYNVDHLIPVRLGGSNSTTNLWPQPLAGEWCWQRKNKLEHRLRKLVCSGRLALKQAQQEIAADWIRAYKKYVGWPRRVQSDQPDRMPGESQPYRDTGPFDLTLDVACGCSFDPRQLGLLLLGLFAGDL
jgi:hypothetical protein